MNNIEKLKDLISESHVLVTGMNSVVSSMGNKALEIDNNTEYEDMYLRYLSIQIQIAKLLIELKTAPATDTGKLWKD